jgi:hypothetical protein
MPAVGVPCTVMVTVAFALATDAVEMGNICKYPDVNEPSCVRRAVGIVPVPAEASNMQFALRASEWSSRLLRLTSTCAPALPPVHVTTRSVDSSIAYMRFVPVPPLGLVMTMSFGAAADTPEKAATSAPTADTLNVSPAVYIGVVALKTLYPVGAAYVSVIGADRVPPVIVIVPALNSVGAPPSPSSQRFKVQGPDFVCVHVVEVTGPGVFVNSARPVVVSIPLKVDCPRLTAPA